MKTKHTLLIILITLSGFLIFSSFLTPQTQNKFLTVKSVESLSGLIDSFILIIDENGKTEEIELEKFRAKNITSNALKLSEIINNKGAKGYELVTATSSGDQYIIVNTYIFVKK